MSDIDTIIGARRSLYPKQFTGEKISDDLITKILENANKAPSHLNTNPWRFKVFTGEGISNFANFVIEQYKLTNKSNIVQAKIDKYKNFQYQVSHIIAVICQFETNERVPDVEEIISTGCAIENIYLSVSEYGLGGYFSTGMGTYSDEMHEALSLSDTQQLLGFFFIGNVDEKAKKLKRPLKKSIESQIDWITD